MTTSSLATATFRVLSSFLLFQSIDVSTTKAADMPALLSELQLPAPVISISAMPDGTRLAVQTRAAKDGPEHIILIDSSNPAAPRQIGDIPIDKAGQMSIAQDGKTVVKACELAISPDGKSLLVAINIGGHPSWQQTRYQLITFDITQPGQPKQIWQQTLSGKDLVLAPDATAYAYLGVNSDHSGQIVVGWLDHRHNPVILSAEQFDLGEPLRLASKGAFLTSGIGIRLTVADLRRQPAVLYSQAKTDTGSWRNQLITLLDSGHLLTADNIVPRFGVYAPVDGVPRVDSIDYSVLPAAGEGYHFHPAASAGGTSLLSDRSGKIYQLDTGQPDKPVLRQTWRFRHGSTPIAIDIGGHVFASRTTGEKSFISIYDLNKWIIAPVNWKALQTAQIAALKIYADKTLVESVTAKRADLALDKFEEADPMLAVDAPVEGISNKAAASILNDYGFLLAKNWTRWESRYSSDDIAAILHRAISLDPDRALAYLNLADFLRGVLPKISDGPRKQALTTEVMTLYRKYLALGAQSADVTAYVASDAIVSASSDICSAVVNYANAGRLAELITTMAADVPVKEHKINFVFGEAGTAHYPNITAFDSADDTPVGHDVYASVDENDLAGGDQLGLIAYRSETHILHYRDTAHPLNSTALSGDKACDFKVETVEQINDKASEPELCKAIHADRGPSAIDFDAGVSMSDDDVRKKYDDTAVTGLKLLDVNNDGHPLNVARFEQSSGSGAGCEAVFFDLVDKDGAHFSPGREADLLMALQQADPKNRYPILPCFNQPKFFAYEGRVYFETRPAGNAPDDSWDQYHRVSRIINGKVEDVCKFTFKTTVSQ
jgi:hypothetical protein